MRSLLAIGATLVVSLVPATAAANGGGVPGYTGKPNLNAPQGESCNQCHTGGTAPTVSLTGPNTLAAGQTGDYSLVVSTGAPRAAAGIAATDGAVLTNVTGLRDSFGELVQNAPVNVSGGQATFRFKVTAPMTGTTMRLWAVGLAANNPTGQTGDRATQTTKDITVTGGSTPPPDAGSSSSSSSGGTSTSSSGGTSTSSSGGSSSGGDGDEDAGAKPGTSSGSSGDPGDADEEDGEESSGGTGGRRGLNASPTDGGACAARPLVGSSEVILSGLTMIALIASIRRRRRPSA